MPSHRLSKSRVVAGLQCHKLLWWRTHEPDASELDIDDALRVVFDRGNHVGELARTFVPDGVLIEFSKGELGSMVEATGDAIDAGADVIYEASFIADDVFVSVDILEKVEEGWVLVEVKSTTRVKEPHFPDAACQTHVLRSAGLNIVRVELMHLNRECRYPDLSDLFCRTDITEGVEEALSTVEGGIQELLSMLGEPLPEVETGSHCTSPYTCPFLARCWPPLPEHHISTLYRGGKRAAALEAEGYLCIDQIPDSENLTKVWSRQREAVKTSQLVFDRALLERDLNKALMWPMGFLDFETVQPPIPCWEGCRPYDQIVVQYSYHVMQEDGGLEHQEHLAQGPDDPRRALAESLIEVCREARVIWTYNIAFERTRVMEMAETFPDLADDLEELIKRLCDLLPVIRDHVYHPDFGGSFSIKKVLPALVPELTYEGLDIGDGQSAAAALERLLLQGEALSEDVLEATREQLLEYCKLDTLAMVRLWERLRALVTP